MINGRALCPRSRFAAVLRVDPGPWSEVSGLPRSRTKAWTDGGQRAHAFYLDKGFAPSPTDSLHVMIMLQDAKALYVS